MTNENGLTAERLRSVLTYDADTGVFRRSVLNRTRYPVGKIAGTPHSSGYIAIGINGKSYKAHRLAWLYVFGEWPTGEIDHINCIKDDNRIANLRVSTRAQNMQNRVAARLDNKLGVLGVSKVGNRYYARIAAGSVQKYLGIHKTIEAAHSAYLQAKGELHGR